MSIEVGLAAQRTFCAHLGLLWDLINMPSNIIHLLDHTYCSFKIKLILIMSAYNFGHNFKDQLQVDLWSYDQNCKFTWCLCGKRLCHASPRHGFRTFLTIAHVDEYMIRKLQSTLLWASINLIHLPNLSDFPWASIIYPFISCFLWGNIKIYLHFLTVFHRKWDSTSGRNSSSCKKKTWLSYLVNMMVADDLVMIWARTSAAIVFNYWPSSSRIF